MPDKNDGSKRDHKPIASGRRSIYDLIQLPTPLKRIFDLFPLKTYAANDLPWRSPHLQGNVLHVFTTEEGSATNAPSFNPACLKWQVGNSFQCKEAEAHSLLGIP